MNNELNIEEYVLKTYQYNLQFLEKEQPKLYKKILSLDLAIEKQYYQEKYILEYKDDAYFDVKEIATNKYLYNGNSYRYGKVAADSIDFQKVNNLFETFYPLSFSDLDQDELNHKDLLSYSYSTVASLVNYSNKYANKNKTTMKKLYKYIFIGTGLGTHLPYIHEKLNSNVYLIIEEDLELFRLSLFVTDYTQLAKNGSRLFFSIFDEEHELKTTIQSFLFEQFIYNHYIKFFHMLHHSQNVLKTIQNTIATQNYLTFNYAAAMTGFLRPLDYIKDGYKILNLNADYSNTPLTQKPVLLIGAGPSFDNNIQWIKKNHKKFIIVIVSALMSKFEEMNIKPDIITHIHGYADAMPHIQKVKNMHFFNNTICLFGGMSYPKFTHMFPKENVYIIEGSSRYKENFGGITASNIGAISYGILLNLKVHSIYLIGLDFALNQDTGETHTQIHSHSYSLDLNKNQQLEDAVDAKKDIIEIDGNFQKKVLSTPLFDAMRKNCNAISYSYKTDTITVYNLSNGAKINDTIPLQPSQITHLKPFEKEELYRELKKVFDQNSENFLSEHEYYNIKQRLYRYDEILQILYKHLQKPYKDLNDYHYHLLGTFAAILAEDIHDKYQADINSVISLYLEFISGYIFDLINTVEIKDEKQLIEQLDQIIIPQIIRVVKYFKEEMQKKVESINIKK